MAFRLSGEAGSFWTEFYLRLGSNDAPALWVTCAEFDLPVTKSDASPGTVTKYRVGWWLSEETFNNSNLTSACSWEVLRLGPPVNWVKLPTGEVPYLPPYCWVGLNSNAFPRYIQQASSVPEAIQVSPY